MWELRVDLQNLSHAPVRTTPLPNHLSSPADCGLLPVGSKMHLGQSYPWETAQSSEIWSSDCWQTGSASNAQSAPGEYKTWFYSKRNAPYKNQESQSEIHIDCINRVFGVWCSGRSALLVPVLAEVSRCPVSWWPIGGFCTWSNSKAHFPPAPLQWWRLSGSCPDWLAQPEHGDSAPHSHVPPPAKIDEIFQEVLYLK